MTWVEVTDPTRSRVHTNSAGRAELLLSRGVSGRPILNPAFSDSSAERNSDSMSHRKSCRLVMRSPIDTRGSAGASPSPWTDSWCEGVKTAEFLRILLPQHPRDRLPMIEDRMGTALLVGESGLQRNPQCFVDRRGDVSWAPRDGGGPSGLGIAGPDDLPRLRASPGKEDGAAHAPVIATAESGRAFFHHGRE